MYPSLSSNLIYMLESLYPCLTNLLITFVNRGLSYFCSSPEALAEAIFLEQRYLVSEPPKDKGQKGVVVPCEAKRTHTLEIPEW